MSKFVESEHPRDDRGRFVEAYEIQAAGRDSYSRQKLLLRVTKPEEREKLQRAFDASGLTPHKEGREPSNKWKQWALREHQREQKFEPVDQLDVRHPGNEHLDDYNKSQSAFSDQLSKAIESDTTENEMRKYVMNVLQHGDRILETIESSDMPASAKRAIRKVAEKHQTNISKKTNAAAAKLKKTTDAMKDKQRQIQELLDSNNADEPEEPEHPGYPDEPSIDDFPIELYDSEEIRDEDFNEHHEEWQTQAYEIDSDYDEAMSEYQQQLKEYLNRDEEHTEKVSDLEAEIDDLSQEEIFEPVDEAIDDFYAAIEVAVGEHVDDFEQSIQAEREADEEPELYD